MPTGTAGTSARQFHQQMVHYLRFDVNYNDTNVATGVGKQSLPAGAIILGTTVLVTTAFNAATTNVLTVGTNSSSYDNIATSAQTVSGTTGLKQNLAPTGTALGKLSAAAQVFVKYTQTGTAASAGAATVMIAYTVANDL